jgi:hypothetical protein
MANAEGGYLAIGFSDGKVEPMTPRRINEMRQAANFAEPPVRITATEILVGDSGAVLVLSVEPGHRGHTTQAGDAYTRRRAGRLARHLHPRPPSDLATEIARGGEAGRCGDREPKREPSLSSGDKGTTLSV